MIDLALRAGGRALRRRPVRPLLLGALLLLALGPACSDEHPATDEQPAAPAAPPGAVPGGPAPAGPPSAAPRFTDVTAAAGIDFVHVNGARGDKLLPETMGGGCAFLDADGDGDQDLLLVGSCRWPDDPAPGPQPTSALYLNDGSGHFRDATAEAGLAFPLYGMGVAAGDVDGDGDPDLYLTAVGPNHLLRNDGGRFTDVTGAAGVAGGADEWSTAAAFLDSDGDGDLDLFVGNYVTWSREIDLALERHLEGIDGRAYLPPTSFAGSAPRLWRNEGDGTFTDVSEAAGVRVLDPATGEPQGKTLAAVPVDVDDDGDTDLFVANDTVRNFLFRNRGDGRFDEEGVELGLAYDRSGNPTGAMGVDLGRFRNDDALGIFVGNFTDEMTSAYVTEKGSGFFTDETLASGLGPATRAPLTFGLLLLDADLDGRLDLLQANGHLEEQIDRAQQDQTYRQPGQLFLNTGEPARPFAPVADAGDLGRPLVGRGAAYADIDGDGDPDVILTQVAGAPLLLRNDQATGHHWLRVRLHPGPDGATVLGARATLTAGDVTQERTLRPTRSYLSQVESVLTFGLGALAAVDTLAVTWPDGTTQQVPVPGVDQVLEVTRNTARPDPERLLVTARARLENGEPGEALELYARARRLGASGPAVLRNVARARLQAGDVPGALQALEEAREADPEDTAAVYLTGVAELRAEHPELALPWLEEAVRRDPRTAALRFQLADACTRLGRADEAAEQLRATVRLDPAHSAAHFQLALAARKAGDSEAFAEHNRAFLRLRALYGDRYQTPVALERCHYTEAEAAHPPEVATAPAEPVVPVRFTDVSADWLGEQGAAALAALSMDDAGRYTFLAAGADGRLARLVPETGGRLSRQVIEATLPRPVRDLVVANLYEAPGGAPEPGALPVRRPDVYLAGPEGGVLLRGGPDGALEDGSEATGLPGLPGRRALAVDAEQDGDLDLLVAADDGLHLLQNGGDGSLAEVGPQVGLPDLGPCVDLAAADLDGDGAVDFVVARGEQPTVVIENRKAGRFAPRPQPPGPWPAARRVLVDELDGDVEPDVALLGPDAVELFLARGSVHRSLPLAGLDPAGMALIDVEGDGRLDLLVVGAADGRGAARLLRNGGRGEWPDASAAAGLDELSLPPLADALAADLDGDGDADLLLRGADGSLAALRNDGGEAGGLLSLRLLSLVDTTGGIGVRVQARAGDHVVTRFVQRELPVELGLDGHRHLDVLQTVWPNGIVHDLIDEDVGEGPLAVAILQRTDTGSCPFLYVWDGTGMRFVSDVVSNGAVGLPLSRSMTIPTNPHEIAVVGDADEVVPRDGVYVLALTSELREAAYFDTASLIAVDHPPGTEVHSTDRFRLPPFPPSALALLADPLPPRSALGDDGLDRTAAVAAEDGVYAPAGPVLPPPLFGVTAPLALELDFGPLPAGDHTVLALTGWIEWGSSSSNIALSQHGDVPVIFPTLAARDGQGRWVDLDVVVGLPAGKHKTILVDLGGKLPPGADRLRLTTTFELHWDRLALMRPLTLADGAVHEVAFTAAELGWHGFSPLAARAPGHARTPAWDEALPRPPWETSMEGWCTAYGDVLSLMAAADGRLVVLNGGDALTLELPAASLPPVPEGQVRTFLLRSLGFNKEADLASAGLGAIWPLGAETGSELSPEEEDAWRLEANTRWVPRDRWSRVPTGGH